MPLTLRDSVRVTRDLGLDYLWVDALCILQDCSEDWQRESKRMGEVYGRAFVTIFAFGARDCEGGLFSPENQRSHSSWKEPRFEDEPLNHRAWALQEWYLSPRRLMFMSYDVKFNCFRGPGHYLGYVSQKLYDQRLLPTSTPSLEPQDWDSLVLNYSTRELTNPLDKLPAIAGLAQRFDKLSVSPNGRYLSGLWEARLPSSLLWHRIGRPWDVPEPSLVRPKAYLGPSWSWISVDGAVKFVMAPYQVQDSDVVARVTKMYSLPALDDDPLGPIVYRLGIFSRMKSLETNRLREEHAESTSIADKTFTTLALTSHEYPCTRAGNIRGDSVMRRIKGPELLRYFDRSYDWGGLGIAVASSRTRYLPAHWIRLVFFRVV